MSQVTGSLGAMTARGSMVDSPFSHSEITLLSVNVTGHWFFGCNDRKGFYGGLPILPFHVDIPLGSGVQRDT